MGRLDVRRNPTPEAVREFSRAVLRDVEALEAMLEGGMLESGVRRIGAEQEVFLTDADMAPACIASDLLEDLSGDSRFTSELARFNLEMNLEPVVAGPDLLSEFRSRLEDGLATLDAAARRRGARVVLTGILPTLGKSHLGADSMMPIERYHALNEAVMKLAGGTLRLSLQGIDEVQMEHDSAMVEACNTSFQVHWQADPESFAQQYNIAQAILAPVLAAAVNSPMFLGRRLWRETRIALFQQATDIRPSSPYPRERLPRVWFGEEWLSGSAAELFKDNIMRYRLLLSAVLVEDPGEVLEAGGVPELSALQLHNGTIYRWNRPCFGVFDGRPHVRIECRALPAGPTIIDEVANAAFWIGLMGSGADAFGDVTERMRFDAARANFIAAARLGLDAGFDWLDGNHASARPLIRDVLLPVARDGLRSLGVRDDDASRYLGIIDRRVETGMTGAQWLIRSDLALRDVCPRPERLATLTTEMARMAATATPVHEWPIARRGNSRSRAGYERVENCMTTDLITVLEDDAVDVVAFIMDQRGVRQLLVENDEGRLVGLVSYRSLLRVLVLGRVTKFGTPVPVRDIMVSDLITVEPATPTVEAIRIMRENRITALPVVQDERLVGIVTEHDFLPVLGRLLRDEHGNGPTETKKTE
jgi:CBS domain-containing protein